jgi:hypothetical protein
MNLRESIRKHLLLEKKIGVIAHEFVTTFKFQIDKTTHASTRSTRPELGSSYEQREISNAELIEFIALAKNKIAEKIVNNEIKDGVPFIIKSLIWELAVSIVPKHAGGIYWELVITTVFRESEENPFRVGKDQVVIWV